MLLYVRLNNLQTHSYDITVSGVHTRVLNWAKPSLFLTILYFSRDKYSTNLTKNDGLLGTRTRGGRKVGADESTELVNNKMTF